VARITEVAEGIFQIRVEDRKIRYFEALWQIPEGITYNAYLLKGDKCSILFDTVKEEFSGEFLEALREVEDISNIKYLVVHHMEPDHSGAIPALLEENPEIEVLGHPLTKGMIESFFGLRPRFRAVKDQELELCGRRIRFVSTPWLHWPETIMSYLPEQGILLSCDAFGSYGIPEEVSSRDVLPYFRETRKYLANVIGHYRRNVIQAIEKLRGLDVRLILPSHGPVWTEPKAIVELYEGLASGSKREKKAVAVYASMYGAVRKAVRRALEKFSSLGFEVLEFPFTDSSWANIADAIGEMEDSPMLVVGAPTYEAGTFPVMDMIVNLIAEKIGREKRILIISSFGWGGVAGKRLAERLKDFSTVRVVEFRGFPSPKELEEIDRAAEELAEGL